MIVLLTLLFVVHTNAFYLPGLAPSAYCSPNVGHSANCKTDIPLFVNKLTSSKSFISYDYGKFDFCPTENKDVPVENLGQVVFGERLQPSDYEFVPLQDNPCQVLCTRTYKGADDRYDFLRSAIVLQYSHHWVVDNLPVTICRLGSDGKRYCSASIPLGCFGETHDLADSLCDAYTREKDGVYLFNHAKFNIFYHQVKDSWGGGGNRIVSVVVEPRSIAHPSSGPDCTSKNPLILPSKVPSDFSITYSYSVEFRVGF